jgi:flagellar biosynthesis/type III secretory pathway protein FliH
MLEIIGVVATVIVAAVAITTAIIQAAKWVWQRGYKAGRADAYKKAERAAREGVAAEVQHLKKLLEKRQTLPGTPPGE